MIEYHLKALNRRHGLAPDEKELIRGLVAETREVPRRTVLIRERTRLNYSTLLCEGLLCRYKDLASGERQVTELHVPGDFADMHSFTLKRLDHGIQTLTDSVVAIVPHDRIRAVTEAHPRLARLYWFGTNLDAAIAREWVVSLGRRDAAERTAALFCELHARMQLVDLADEGGFALPLSQSELAECLGLTAVHVNRTLRFLREAKLLQFQSGRVELLDLPGLRRLADFDDHYLYLNPDPL